MTKLQTSELMDELRVIEPRLELVPNPNREGLSNIKINGVDICPVPSLIMQDEHTPDYVYVFPNGMVGKMKTYEEAKQIVLGVIEKLKDTGYSKDFYAKDE